MAGLFNEIDRFTEMNQGGAACSFCGQHPTERLREDAEGNRVKRRARVFRTNLHIHMEGWIEVCEWCLEEGAKAIGMDTSEKVAAFLHQIDLLEDERGGLECALDEARATITSLTRELARREDEEGEKLAAAAKQAWEDGHTAAELELADAG